MFAKEVRRSTLEAAPEGQCGQVLAFEPEHVGAVEEELVVYDLRPPSLCPSEGVLVLI